MKVLRGLAPHDPVALDFDETIGKTSSPSPHGMNVDVACAHALDTLFNERGLLRKIGGVRCRAPGELIQGALALDPAYAGRALAFYERESGNLAQLVPAGKGIDLRQAEATHDTLALATETFIRLKLQLLVGEIGYKCGRPWPLPCDYVFEFIESRGKRIAILSSGHELFIQTFFQFWGVDCPVLVTDDDLRGLPLPIEEKCKPHPRLVDVLIGTWERARVHVLRERVAYFGDSSEKDGLLARNAGVRFGWYNPSRHKRPAGAYAGTWEVHDWRQLIHHGS